MILSASDTRPRRLRDARAFTLVEACVAMGLVGVIFIGLYASLAWGFASLRLTRENLRATQILTEKMETIRLYTWDQVTVISNFLPTTFTATYYPPGETNTYGTGTIYSGTLSVEPVAFGTNYDDDMRKVTVKVNWVTGGLPRSRSLTTFVSQYGMQNYVW
jgi:type II secretory pathway pseudopilin PulG